MIYLTSSSSIINDFPSESPLAGIYFQKDLEEKAFVLGGSNYYAPIQRVEDFLQDKKSTFIGKIEPTYLPGVTLSNLNDIEDFDNLSIEIYNVKIEKNGKMVTPEANNPKRPSNMLELKW